MYYGVLRNGQAAAIKKLDSSKQPDQEFLAQVSSYKEALIFEETLISGFFFFNN